MAFAFKKLEYLHHFLIQRTLFHIQPNSFTFNKIHSHATKFIYIQQNFHSYSTKLIHIQQTLVHIQQNWSTFNNIYWYSTSYLLSRKWTINLHSKQNFIENKISVLVNYAYEKLFILWSWCQKAFTICRTTKPRT